MSRRKLIVPYMLVPTIGSCIEKGTVSGYQHEIGGYQLYLVEQWACSRNDEAIAIIAFTGHNQHKVNVLVCEVPDNEADWPQCIKSYTTFMTRNHARSHSLTIGEILIINLSTFPSALTILPMPQGNLKANWNRFITNESLKRLGCSGRSAVSFSEPSQATTSRFCNIYKVSSRIGTTEAILGLVSMCQASLAMFGNLDESICDGFLCDITIQSISAWWTRVGSQYYNVAPEDDILSSTTVAALIGLLIGARNRLHNFGSPVPKDAFNLHLMRKGVVHFQKSQHLEKTKLLDPPTLQRLHRMTAKSASSEGWGVPRAVKSTVAELGKGGEMVMGMVGARERAGIAEIETINFDQFLERLSGQTCKWLWRGKAFKSPEFISLLTHQDNRNISNHNFVTRILDSSESEDHESEMRSQNQNSLRSGLHPKLLPSSNSEVESRTMKSRRDQINITETSSRKETDIEKTGTGKGVEKSQNIGKEKSLKEEHKNNQYSSGQYGSTHKANFSHGKNGVEREGIGSTVAMNNVIRKDDMQQAQHFHTTGLRGPMSIQAIQSTGKAGNPGQFFSEMEEGIRRRSQSTSSAPAKLVFDGIVLCSFSETLEHSCEEGDKFLGSPNKTFSGAEQGHSTHEVSRGDDFIRSIFSQSGTEYFNDTNLPRAIKLLDNLRVIREKFKKPTKDVEEYMDSLSNKIIDDTARITAEGSSISNYLDAAFLNSQEIMSEASESNAELVLEIDALGAKLEYELGVLCSRIEDVEDGIADLDRQISELESRGVSLGLDTQNQTWQNWLENLVRRIGLV